MGAFLPIYVRIAKLVSSRRITSKLELIGVLSFGKHTLLSTVMLVGQGEKMQEKETIINRHSMWVNIFAAC